MHVDGARRLKGSIGFFLQSFEFRKHRAKREIPGFSRQLQAVDKSGKRGLALRFSHVEKPIFGLRGGSESATTLEQWKRTRLRSLRDRANTRRHMVPAAFVRFF